MTGWEIGSIVSQVAVIIGVGLEGPEIVEHARGSKPGVTYYNPEWHTLGLTYISGKKSTWQSRLALIGMCVLLVGLAGEALCGIGQGRVEAQLHRTDEQRMNALEKRLSQMEGRFRSQPR